MTTKVTARKMTEQQLQHIIGLLDSNDESIIVIRTAYLSRFVPRLMAAKFGGDPKLYAENAGRKLGPRKFKVAEQWLNKILGIKPGTWPDETERTERLTLADLAGLPYKDVSSWLAHLREKYPDRPLIYIETMTEDSQ